MYVQPTWISIFYTDQEKIYIMLVKVGFYLNFIGDLCECIAN
jgi:hypothetical protein